MNLSYFAIGLLRRHVPERLLFRLMELRGDGSVAEKNSDGLLEQWRQRLARQGLSFEGKSILEVGSGRYALFGLQLLHAGARDVTLVDFYAQLLNDPQHRELLQTEANRLGICLDNALRRIRVIRGDLAAQPRLAAAQQVDIAMSNTVLEHVRDPKAILRSCYDWLQPGGLSLHVIDMRDHNLQFRYPFEMLTYSQKMWERWLDLRGGFHLNRWRISSYLQASAEAGFTLVYYEPLMSDAKGLEESYARLHPMFRTEPKQLLALQGVVLYGTKPLR